MKLYSRTQVVFYSAISSFLAVFLVALFFLIAMPPLSSIQSSGKFSKNDKSSNQSDNGDNQINRTPVLFNKESQSQPGSSFSQDEMENISIYKKFNAGVVNITTITVAYNWFLEAVPQEGGSGSGSIIDQEGHILTNYHVVKDADELTITLADGSDYKGKLVGADPENDLAIVKFDPAGKKLIVIPFGSSADLAVGQKVLAIGNPFGLERTLTQGIVSALGRPIKSESGTIIRQSIQTDASINPGNSGGPLINSHGEMIGVNTMIYSPSGGSVGIGFAVPVDTAKRIIPDLLRFGMVKRGWIQITPVQLFPALVRYARYPISNGILVSQTDPGGNAESSGIKGGETPVRYGRSIIYIGGDIITEVDGMAIENLSDLYSSLEDKKPGQTVSVKVLRNSKYVIIKVKLSERPKSTG
jgi:S1-C subfamily serine protease